VVAQPSPPVVDRGKAYSDPETPGNDS
jgi:hypothetical protein